MLYVSYIAVKLGEGGREGIQSADGHTWGGAQRRGPEEWPEQGMAARKSNWTRPGRGHFPERGVWLRIVRSPRWRVTWRWL